MHVLLTGATGYIGQLLLDRLVNEGHKVTCCVRTPEHLPIPEQNYEGQVEVLQVDFLKVSDQLEIPGDIDVAYYLIHSMSNSTQSFDSMELQTAKNFNLLLDGKGVKQVIYLSGISNDDTLSKHLKSRFRVEQELRKGPAPVTVLRAGIIVGAGSASFELIRDLAEKLPVMIAPKWLSTRCQPLASDNVLDFLTGVALRHKYFDKTFDIGGPDVLTYKEMLMTFAEVRGLTRYIFTVPLMTPRLSSYWLFFVTTVSYPLAVNLVDSMKVEVIAAPNSLAEELGIELISYRDAILVSLQIYGRDRVLASWKDAVSSSYEGEDLVRYKKVPEFGVFLDYKEIEITGREDQVLENVWSIGGERGWYYGNWLWKVRGVMDKMVGGVGLRRGRTHKYRTEAGDALDFWRVLDADKNRRRLLLFAEMKLPGEAWLEFKIEKRGDKTFLKQTATFRPKGLLGRLYWYSVLPLHFFVFGGMIREISNYEKKPMAAEPVNA